jgi:hypothetical protein
MDPNLFHLDWERLAEVLAGVVVMAFLVERALSLLFGNEHYILHLKDKHVKELIAFVVSAVVCWYWDFDALSMIFLKDQTTFPGFVVTGGVVAGGSKASVKLFKDIMGFKSDAEKRLEATKDAEVAVEGGKPA